MSDSLIITSDTHIQRSVVLFAKLTSSRTVAADHFDISAEDVPPNVFVAVTRATYDHGMKERISALKKRTHVKIIAYCHSFLNDGDHCRDSISLVKELIDDMSDPDKCIMARSRYLLDVMTENFNIQLARIENDVLDTTPDLFVVQYNEFQKDPTVSGGSIAKEYILG